MEIFKRIDEYEKKARIQEATDIRRSVALRLRAYRLKNQLTQEKLAEQLGVTRMEIIRWESGTTTPGNLALRLLKQKEILE